MGRPKKAPTTVVRLPTELVERIDELRGERSRAEFLDALVPWRDEYDGSPPPPRGEVKGVGRVDRVRRGSPSPSLRRFG